MSVNVLVRLLLLVVLCDGCVSQPASENRRQAVWMVYARNIPHGAQHRESILMANEAPAVVVVGFPDQFVTISFHDAVSGRLITQTTQFVQSHVGLGIRMKPLRPGRYIVRASQEGVLKAESTFSVR